MWNMKEWKKIVCLKKVWEEIGNLIWLVVSISGDLDSIFGMRDESGLNWRLGENMNGMKGSWIWMNDWIVFESSNGYMRIEEGVVFGDWVMVIVIECVRVRVKGSVRVIVMYKYKVRVIWCKSN